MNNYEVIFVELEKEAVEINIEVTTEINQYCSEFSELIELMKENEVEEEFLYFSRS